VIQMLMLFLSNHVTMSAVTFLWCSAWNDYAVEHSGVDPLENK
jgi:hypothetical protein